MSTLRVRGTGGAEFDIDDPFEITDESPDSRQKEVYREQLENRQLFRVDEVHEDADPGSGSGTTLEEPARNASTEDWRAYAIAKGATETDVADLKRDELVELYATPQA